MTVDDFLDHVIERSELYNRRLETAIAGKLDEALLRHPHEGVWSPIQVVEHMTLANNPYLPLMKQTIETASKGAPAREIKHSLFGRMVIRASGPSGNYPSPAALHPKEHPDVATTLATWREQQAELIRLAETAKGIDLTVVGVRNPFIRWGRMNLADCFEILTVHTDRHTGQIVERVA